MINLWPSTQFIYAIIAFYAVLLLPIFIYCVFSLLAERFRASPALPISSASAAAHRCDITTQTTTQHNVTTSKTAQRQREATLVNVIPMPPHPSSSHLPLTTSPSHLPHSNSSPLASARNNAAICSVRIVPSAPTTITSKMPQLDTSAGFASSPPSPSVISDPTMRRRLSDRLFGGNDEAANSGNVEVELQALEEYFMSSTPSPIKLPSILSPSARSDSIVVRIPIESSC